MLFGAFLAMGIQEANACHGLALIGYNVSNNGSSITINASSDAATCGCGPYYIEVELVCFNAANFTGAAPSCTAAGWNTYPWYHELLDVPNYNAANGWQDQCAQEPYLPLTIQFNTLCAGTTYWFRARERICAGTNGPWTAAQSFTTPGVAPSYTLSATATPNPVCSGTPVQLSATLNGTGSCGTGAPTYTWNPGNLTGQNIMVTPTVTTVYTLTATGGVLTCYGAPPTTVTVTVQMPPTPGTASVSPGTVCQGSCVTLTLTGYNGTIQWQSSPNGTTWTNIAGATTTPYQYCPVNAPTYFQAVVASTAGCGTANSNIVSVNMSPVQPLTITPNNPSICTGQSVTLNVTGASGYQWFNGNTNIGSGSSITVTPGTTTTYSVTANQASACPSSQSVTVTVNPLPVLTFSPTAPAVCAGDSVMIDAGSGTNNYTWTPATGLTFLSASQDSVIASPSATTSYNVTATTTAGCSTTGQITVSVNAITVDAGNNISICASQSAVLNGSGGTNYSWTPNNPAIISGATTATPTVTPTITTTFTVNVTNGAGCAGVDSVTVTVGNMPVANAGPDVAICYGDQIVLNGSGGSNYAWTGPSIISGSATSAVTVAPLVSATYSLTVTNQSGCMDTNSVFVLVNPLPLANAGANQTICGINCANLNATGGAQYAWSPGTGLSSTTTAATTACPPATTTYTVTVTSNAGCVNSDSITVTVNPPLVLQTSTNAFICTATSTVLNATVSGGDGGPYNYSWSPATGLSNPTIASPIASPAVTTTYVITVTDNCGSVAETGTVIVTVFPATVVSITAQNISGCAPVCVDFVGSSTPAAVSCIYDFGDSNTGTNCNETHCYPLAGSYTVIYTVTDVNGCQGSVSHPNLVNVYPNPVAGFTVSPQVTTILAPQVIITPNCFNCDTTTYFMNDPNETGLITNNVLPFTFTYTDTGYFLITQYVVNQYGCVDSATEYVIVNPDWSFFSPTGFTPNNDGLNDIFMVAGEGINNTTFEMGIYDRWGNRVFVSDDIMKGWDGTVNGGIQAQIDAYVWHVTFRDRHGEMHNYHGYVALIR